jgi:pilus assembly protein CpaB
MNVRSLILALVAVLIAAGAAMGVRSLVSGSQTPQVVAAPAPKTPDKMVLVAVKPLPTGHIIAIEDMKWVEWPKDGVDPQFYVKGVTTEQSMAGKVIKTPVAQGAPLLTNQIVGPGERGFLAAVLGKDMRAVTVAVSDTSGVGGFVFPGDRVDLVLTHEVPNGANLPLRGAETILTNVRVLAVNEKTDDTGQAGANASIKSVTLEVPPPFVENIAVMQRLGAISLSLRPITDSVIAPTDAKGAANKVVANVDAAKNSKDPVKAAAAAAVAARTDMEAPLVMPSDKNRTLTVDRQVSKLVTMARQQGGGSTTVSGGGSTAPAKPDIMISRADKSDPIIFTPKSAGSSSAQTESAPPTNTNIIPTERAQ